MRPGITTLELDRIAEDSIRSAGAVPSFLGYAQPPFPACICVSVNDEVVHGIPGPRVLAEGDIVSIDCGAIVDGWHGDAALTVAVGEVPPGGGRADGGHRGGAVARASRLRPSAATSATSPPPWSGTSAAGVTSASSRTTPGTGSARRCTSRRTCPTGASRAGDPSSSRGSRSRSSRWWWSGEPWTHTDDDQWTVRTDDGSLAAHYEHTFTLTDRGTWVLTALDGGEARLAELGVRFGGR